MRIHLEDRLHQQIFLPVQSFQHPEEYPDRVIGIRARRREVIVDWDEDDTEIIEDILPSDLGDLCDALWNRRMIKAARESLKKLSRRDQMILKAWNAICNNCGGIRQRKEQYQFREISNLIGGSTDKGGQRKASIRR